MENILEQETNKNDIRNTLLQYWIVDVSTHKIKRMHSICELG